MLGLRNRCEVALRPGGKYRANPVLTAVPRPPGGVELPAAAKRKRDIRILHVCENCPFSGAKIIIEN